MTEKKMDEELTPEYALSLRTSGKELRRDENELNFILDRLMRIESIQITNETWRDYTEAWEALIQLRKRILCERGHAIIRCIVADQAVVDGLGAAFQMLQIQGDPPNEILIMLGEGPATHIHQHLFKYRSLIDKEIFGIRRIKDLKSGAAGLVSGAVVALMIGVANSVVPVLLESWFGIGTPQADLGAGAGGAAANSTA